MPVSSIRFVLLFCGFAAPALAGDPYGLWVSPPDPKGQTGHLELTPCGDKLCGTLTRAFDKEGQPVSTPNVGKKLLWDMAREAEGKYSGGQVFVPLMNSAFPAQMEITGDRLEVRGCNKAGLCRSQVWMRLR